MVSTIEFLLSQVISALNLPEEKKPILIDLAFQTSKIGLTVWLKMSSIIHSPPSVYILE